VSWLARSLPQGRGVECGTDDGNLKNRIDVKADLPKQVETRILVL
jgi:hypothetical protein